MLLKGNRVACLPCYRKAVTISTPRSEKITLYGNRILEVPHFQRIDCKYNNQEF